MLPVTGVKTDDRELALFLIFDYCGNFEYFRTKPNGYEGAETKTLSENIFGKKVRLAAALQEAGFSEEEYQNWRSEIVKDCHERVAELNTALVSVHLKLQYVEKYRNIEAFAVLGEGAIGELITHVAPLVNYPDKDEYAKRFDNFMYGLILAHVEGLPSFRRARKTLCDTASALERMTSIPQVNAKIKEIREINTDEYWAAENILLFEETRNALRDLIKFLVNNEPKQPIITRLEDTILDQTEGQPLDPAYDFEDYRKKVNRYVEENGNTLAIHKLTHNIPLSPADYEQLERILTEELGSREDYEREYGDTPFGLLIRKIAKLDHEAAMAAFSGFINDASLNQKQIAFVYKIINHIEQNGYMENTAALLKPPFDKPVSFIKLFDPKTRTALMQTIQTITDNATNIVA